MPPASVQYIYADPRDCPTQKYHTEEAIFRSILNYLAAGVRKLAALQPLLGEAVVTALSNIHHSTKHAPPNKPSPQASLDKTAIKV